MNTATIQSDIRTHQMPVATKTKKASSAELEQLAAELEDIGDAQGERLGVVHKALYNAGPDGELPAKCLSALTLIGDEEAIKKARRDATGGRSAVKEYKATKGADKKAEAAAKERDAKVPGLREQIARLEAEVRQLENAPVQLGAEAERHERAAKRIRDTAPAFIRQQVRATGKRLADPLSKQRAELNAELGQLKGWTMARPQQARDAHMMRGAVDPDTGGKPWIMTDAHGRTVVNPQAWRAFLEKVDAFARRDELQQQVDAIDAKLDQLHADNAKQLDYWLRVDDELGG